MTSDKYKIKSRFLIPVLKKYLNKHEGVSLVEMLVVLGIMSILVFAMLSVQENQLKSNSYLEFQLKKIQLQNTLNGQFLNTPNNCACLFAGANPFPASPAAPGATLAGVAPTQIGIFSSAFPACGVPAQFFIDNIGIDGIRLTSVQLQNIVPTLNPNVYSGVFNLRIQSVKQVMGPSDLTIPIPVNISVVLAGANVNFASCTVNAPTVPPPNYSIQSCVINVNKWLTAQFTNTECAPPPCAATETTYDTGCVASDAGGFWTTLTCNRLCYSGALPSGFESRTSCPFGIMSNGPLVGLVCAPPACPAGFANKYSRCEGTYHGGGEITGYCERNCQIP